MSSCIPKISVLKLEEKAFGALAIYVRKLHKTFEKDEKKNVYCFGTQQFKDSSDCFFFLCIVIDVRALRGYNWKDHELEFFYPLTHMRSKGYS